MGEFRSKRAVEIKPLFKSRFSYVLNRSPETARKRSDTGGEITTRRQKPLVLRIMVEQGRTVILFLSGITPRCEQIFPHRCCFSQSGEFANSARPFAGPRPQSSPRTGQIVR